MAKKQGTSSRQKEQKETEKKLRKNERRLRDRLLAMHKVQSRAIERLQRAEARVQKIMLRAKRVEDRLIEVRLQLEGVRDATDASVDLVIIPPQQGQLQVEEVVGSDNITPFPVKEVEEEPVSVQELHVEDASVQPVESTRADTAQHDDTSQPPSEEHAGYPTPEEFARVEEITLAEENIEIAASMSAAEAAGVAAANAEALAEASSARANEARLVVQQADHFLEQVRNAVRDGFMRGEEAEKALNAAENEATYAHALLANAEAVEERARNEAMNAEAEAEVAEGMSLSADAHARDTVTNLDREGTEHTNGVAASPDAQDEATAPREEDEDSDLEDTAELHATHLREHE